MAQTGYTPILIYSSSTAAQAPAVGNLTNSTLGSELAINITDGKLFYKDNANAVQVIAWKTTPTTAGGTGLTSYTAGDLLYYASGTTLSKLAIGTSGQWLGSSGTAPQWNSPAALTKTDDTNVTLTLGGSASTALLNAASLTLGWTGQLAVTRGGTGLSSVAQGDILYGSAANTLSALAKNTTATRYLSNTGASNNPAWAQIDLTNGVTGTLPVGNGGTGLTTLTANRVLYASATNTVGTSANLTFDGTTLQITSGSVNLGSGGANGYISGNTWYGINSGDWVFQAGNASQGFRWNGSSGSARMYLDINSNLLLGTTSSPAGSGNFLINNGNVIQGTAAKGFNFTANTAAAGMTSQLLNWYEEGTFDPRLSFATGGDTCSYSGRTGRYTRIGRLVTVNIYVGLTAKGSGTGNVTLINLPFTAGSYSSAVPRVVSMTSTGTVSAYIYSGQSVFTFFSVNTAGTETQITDTNITNSTEIVLTLSYIV